MFVENRYTDNYTYWPHLAFRDLWQLSAYIAPSQLRMEFLNPYRNAEKYAADPLEPGGTIGQPCSPW